MAYENPHASKKAKIYGPEVLKELDADNVRAIVAVHGQGMLDYFDKMHAEGMAVDKWTDEDTLRLLNTRLGRAKLRKIQLKNNFAKLKGYFGG